MVQSCVLCSCKYFVMTVTSEVPGWCESEDSRDLFHTLDLFRWPLSLSGLSPALHNENISFPDSSIVLFFLANDVQTTTDNTAANTINKQGWNSRWAAALHYVQSKFTLETKYGWGSVSPPRQTWMNNEMGFYKSTAFLREFPSAAGEQHTDTSIYWCETAISVWGL